MLKTIDRFFSWVPLTLKMLIITSLVGMTGFYLINKYDKQILHSLFANQEERMIDVRGQEDKHNFERYAKSFLQIVTITLSQKSLYEYMQSSEWLNPTLSVKEYSITQPEWFPSESLLKDYPVINYAILFDKEGLPRQVYENSIEKLPNSLLKPQQSLFRNSTNQIYTATVDGRLLLIAYGVLQDSAGKPVAHIVLASHINDLFLSFAHENLTKDHIVAIFAGNEPVSVASNMPQLIRYGTPLSIVSNNYYLEEHLLHDLSPPAIPLRFVSLFPKNENDPLIQSIIRKKWIDNSIITVIVIASFIVIIYWITSRIEHLTIEIVNYTQSYFGTKPGKVKLGDELLVLENRFEHMMDEINSYREEINKAKGELETKVIERTEELWETNGKLLDEIEERKKAEEKNRRNYLTQNVISSVLSMSLQPSSLEELLQDTLNLILSIPWLSLQSKGAIFLLDEKGITLNMTVQKDLSPVLLDRCANLPLGRCLCGMAAKEKRIVFSNHIDEDHEIKYDSMMPHGHFCVPIIYGERVLGVINLYIKDSHLYNKEEEDFLKAIANTIAGVIERSKVSDELAHSHTLLQTLIDSIPDSIYFKDKNNRFVKVNKAKAMHSGTIPEKMLGRTDFDFLKEEDAKQSFEDDEFVKLNGITIENKIERHTRKNGDEVWLSVYKLPWRDKAGDIIGTMGISRDITQLKSVEEKLLENEKQLSFLAYHDPLTTLPNRLLFSDRIKQTIAYSKRQNKKFALMFLDLDHFKDINDTLGHDKGDELLKEVAKRLKQCIRESDTVARQGGDEFVFLLADIHSREDVKSVTSKIIKTLETDFLLGDTQMSITTSIGISIFPKDGENIDTLVKKADIALYNAKAAGRNNYQFYNVKIA
ncbi:MAG: diguanylate cyclase [Candidatus Magnetoovum sp. WYHC-5]|nr:diguanylate cyclase [Candidatus Magnetoovum sp. WYHC-5]